MTDDTMSYTMDPFEKDHYWIIASEDLSQFMAAGLDEDPEPRIVFFEVEEHAIGVSKMDIAPEHFRDCVRKIEGDACLTIAEKLHEEGFQVAIALENGFLLALTLIPIGPEVVGEA